jgi:GNAT superfamily N-acetyltransferase
VSDAGADPEPAADDPTVRPAADDAEATTARSVLDAAMLELPEFDARAAAGDVLVALSDDRIVGAALLAPHDDRPGVHLEAIAVRPRRRDQGIGTAVVAAAAERGPVTAEFEAELRPFYERLGFEIRRLDGDRYRGVLEP